jgi:hypothetical protein
MNYSDLTPKPVLFAMPNKDLCPNTKAVLN